MCGKCYGCGSTEHLKAAGHRGRLTHQDSVCQDKFMGKGPQTVNRVAANTFSSTKDNKDQMIDKLQKELENLQSTKESDFQ